MAKNVVTNEIKIQDPQFGEYAVSLTNDQIKGLVKRGAVVFEKIRKAEKDGLSVPYINITRRGPTPAEDLFSGSGFVGNQIKWKTIFPDNSNIDELIKKAKKFEDDFRLAMKAFVAFLSAGFSTGLGGATTDSLGKTLISGIVGPFTKLYIDDKVNSKD